MEMRIIDKDGVWLQNTGSFVMLDYGRQAEGMELVKIEPGDCVKITLNGFLAGQSTLQRMTMDADGNLAPVPTEEAAAPVADAPAAGRRGKQAAPDPAPDQPAT